jgi:hypothetical protein
MGTMILFQEAKDREKASEDHEKSSQDQSKTTEIIVGLIRKINLTERVGDTDTRRNDDRNRDKRNIHL